MPSSSFGGEETLRRCARTPTVAGSVRVAAEHASPSPGPGVLTHRRGRLLGGGHPTPPCLEWEAARRRCPFAPTAGAENGGAPQRRTRATARLSSERTAPRRRAQGRNAAVAAA